MTAEPVFLLALPRTGSTLVQRVLAAHPGVATTAEPWLALPLIAALRGDQPGGSEEWHAATALGIEGFVQALPGGRQEYVRAIETFLTGVYARAAASSGAGIFLDKSPGYTFIADLLPQVLPDAKCVFLWRNPLAVIASMNQSWHGGRWAVHEHRGQLFDGLANLIATRERGHPRAIAIQYERLLTGRSEWVRLATFLGLEFDESTIVRLPGPPPGGLLGDTEGVRAYASLSSEPLTKWPRHFSTAPRRAWARRYLAWIGDERLGVMGYSRGELIDQLTAEPAQVGGAARDVVDMVNSMIREAVKARSSASHAMSAWRRVLR